MTRKIGLSSTPPRNEARPLGTPKPLKVRMPKFPVPHFVYTKAYAGTKDVDTSIASTVAFTQIAAIPPDQQQEHLMTLTFSKLSKKSNYALYTGAANVLRLPVGAFPDKIAPATIEVVGNVFAIKTVKTPKVKLTVEERKALRASKPKSTAAERVAQMEARLAKAKAKLLVTTSM